MRRRALLKALGGAVGAASLPGARPAAATGPAETGGGWDVVVIGGGFAGVTAARDLAHAGLRVVLLEARGRLGGRTFSVRVGDDVFELGGTWVHSTQPHVWAEITRYGLALDETPGAVPERVFWWSGGAPREAGIREVVALVGAALCAGNMPAPPVPLAALQASALIADLMSRFHEGAAAAFPRPFDPFFADGWRLFDRLSVRDRLDQLGLSADRRALLEGLLGASCHGAFAECGFVEMLRWWALSGHDLERYNDSVARFRLREGTSRLIDAMIADGRPAVRLGTPVVRVTQEDHRVTVVTEGGEGITARAAIVTVPMNVLAHVEFSPPLDPAKIAAARERHAGAGVKVYARVRGEVPVFAAFAAESEPFSMIFTSAAGRDGGVLIAFGTSPRRIDVHDAAAVQAAVRRFLPHLEVTGTFAYDWHLDPYSLGTWCVLRPGQLTKYLAKLREPEGRVHFASGDSALGWRGFIDGAIESGSRVAQAVVAQLRGVAAAAAPPAGVAVTADAAAFAPCAVCHSADESGRHGVGPNLAGVAGRPAASASGFPYSPALRDRGITWTAQALDAFLTDPAGFAPGTTMAFAGLRDPAARAAVIRFLLGGR